MPELSLEAVSILFAALANTFFVGRIYGQITSKLNVHDSRHERHETRLDAYATALQSQGERISYMKGGI